MVVEVMFAWLAPVLVIVTLPVPWFTEMPVPAVILVTPVLLIVTIPTPVGGITPIPVPLWILVGRFVVVEASAVSRKVVLTKLLRLAVETKFSKFWLETNPVRLAVETKFKRFCVDTKPVRFAVETKLLRLAVLTKFKRFCVLTRPERDAELIYPVVPNPAMDDWRLETRAGVPPFKVDTTKVLTVMAF